MMNTNPFTEIQERFDKLENLFMSEVEKLKFNQLSKQNSNEHLTRKDVKEQYKISYGTIHNAMNRGKLHFSKVGRKTLFKRKDVEAFINSKGASNE